METKEIIPNLNKKVMWQGREYIFTGCTIRKNEKGEIFYQAELHELHCNSILIVRLGDVNVM